MILTIITNWNVIMTIGATLSIVGVSTSLLLFTYCFLNMEYILRSKGKINKMEFMFPFMIYSKFKQFANESKEEKTKYELYISLLSKSLIVAPLILITGLIVMVIGKGFLCFVHSFS